MKIQTITLTNESGTTPYILHDYYDDQHDALSPESPIDFFDPEQGADWSDMEELLHDVLSYDPDEVLTLEFDAFHTTTTCTASELAIMLANKGVHMDADDFTTYYWTYGRHGN